MYEQNRYCRHLSQDDLDERLRDLFLNMLILTPEAKIGVDVPSQQSASLWELLTHALHEMALRHGPYPAGFTSNIFHRAPLPELIGERAQKAAQVFASRHLQPGSVLIKFGQAVHMKAMYDFGRIRIQPASFYKSLDHNGAIRDDELALALSIVLSRDDVVGTVLNPEDVPPGAGDQQMDVTFSSPHDYWLFCTSMSLGARLFNDFEADACVIIKDRGAFVERLGRATAAAMSGALAKSGPALYVDPHRPSNVSNIYLPMAKHFRYAYQQEFRFAWLPAAPAEILPYVDVELGSLADIAELVLL